MQFVSYRSTFTQQISICRSSFESYFADFRTAQKALRAERSCDKPDKELCEYLRQRVSACRSLAESAFEQYRGLMSFERECERRRIARRISSELAIHAEWAKHGLHADIDKGD